MEFLFTIMFRVSIFLFVLSLTGAIVMGSIYLRRNVLGSPRPLASKPRDEPTEDPLPIFSYQGEPADDGDLPDDTLANGWQRGDYHRFGITDEDIEFWGFDQPGAPEPYSASRMVAESMLD